jgi:hypothetical protein
VAAFLSITAVISETTLPDSTQLVPPPQPGTLHVGTEGDGSSSGSPVRITGPGTAISPTLGLAVPTSSATGVASPLAPSQPAARKSHSKGSPRDRGPAQAHGRGSDKGHGTRQATVQARGKTGSSAAVASGAEPDQGPVAGQAGDVAATPPGSPAAPAGVPPGLAKKPGGVPPGLAKKPGGLPPGLAKKH